jgi:hypothetical protein
MLIFPMLMCIVSLTFYKTLDVTVHNRHPNIELTSTVYFCNCGTYYKSPIERTDAGDMMKTNFRFDPDQDEVGGLLMYEAQSKNNAISDHQSSIDTVYAKVIEETLKMTRLLVTWKIKHLEESKVNIMLIEYGNELILNEDRLALLYEKFDTIPPKYCYPHVSTWSLSDSTVLLTTYKVIQKEDVELKVVISKGVKDKYTMKPLWIDSER